MQKSGTWNRGEIVHHFSCQHLPNHLKKKKVCTLGYDAYKMCKIPIYYEIYGMIVYNLAKS